MVQDFFHQQYHIFCNRFIPRTHRDNRTFPTPCNPNKASCVSFGGGRGLFQRLTTQLGACYAMAEDVGYLGFHGAGWEMVGEVEKNGATMKGTHFGARNSPRPIDLKID